MTGYLNNLKKASYKAVLDTNLVFLQPWHSVFEKVAVCNRTKREQGRFGEVKFVKHTQPLYHLDEELQIGIIPAGLFGAIKGKVHELGGALEIIDQRPPLPEMDVQALKEAGISLRYRQGDILAAIGSSYGGIIKVPTAYGKTFLMELLPILYPDLKIMFVTRASDTLSSIYERVKARNPRKFVIIVKGGHAFHEKADVAVVSAKSLHKVDTEWPDLMVFDEVHWATAEETSEYVQTFSTCRRFGMSASPKGKGDKSDVILEALFGPVLVDIHYSDAVSSGNVSCIKVHMYDVNAVEVPRKTPVSYDRHNIWRNASRNYIIANKAQKYLNQYGQVLVLVDRVEHMLYLHKLIPNAVCVCSKMTKDQEEQFRSWKLMDDSFVIHDKDEVRRKFAAGEIPFVMSTIFKEGVDFPDLPVVVRCDGGGNPISGTQMKGRLSRITESKTEGILVDFYDGFSSRLKRRSDARITQYREDGAEVERMQP